MRGGLRVAGAANLALAVVNGALLLADPGPAGLDAVGLVLVASNTVIGIWCVVWPAAPRHRYPEGGEE